MLNLIDTPGHVDFHYEVSRALAACEGALLVVDAAQGVEAQTVANAYLADRGRPRRSCRWSTRSTCPRPGRKTPPWRSSTSSARPAEDCIFASAKTGEGIDETDGGHRRAAARRRTGDPDAPTRALIFDSDYDDYRGVIIYVRVFDGHAHASATRSA